MVSFCANRRRFLLPVLLAAALLIVCWQGTAALAESSFDHIFDFFIAMTGYAEDAPCPYQPTCLNFVCFSHGIALDSAVLDGDDYVLHGADAQDVCEYVEFITRYGYTVVYDTTAEDGVRYVELRDLDAPDYLPRVFRLYYYPQYQAIVTISASSAEERYAAYVAQRREAFDDELYESKILESGICVSLEETRCVSGYYWADTEHPLCRDAFPGLVRVWMGTEIPMATVSDGTQLVNMVSGAETGYIDAYWLLRVDVTTSSQTFAVDDWTFCIADDDMCVYYPLQIGSRLDDEPYGLLLSADAASDSHNATTVWLAFPAFRDNGDLVTRLYIARAADHVPLLERTCIGFVQSDEPETPQDPLDWANWEFESGGD
ncbi:MAG TPA: hypothetical protein PK537_00350 [Candidatus Limiplasma sp.]|nr:hypothetical protein [Candidatus Limiplasma sp.]